jgi:hypothetical protein
MYNITFLFVSVKVSATRQLPVRFPQPQFCHNHHLFDWLH